MSEYIDSFNNIYDVYNESLKKSLIFDEDKELEIYFSNDFILLDELDRKIIELYSEYLILFPNVLGKSKKKKIPIFFYIYQYFFSKKAIHNFIKTIPKNISEDEVIKLKFSACRTISSLLANGEDQKNEDLFQFLDFNQEGTIYYEPKIHNLKFIEQLKENSEIFPILLQLNSGSSTNYLKKDMPTFSSRITMLSLKDVKKHLNLSIPNYGIRLKCLSHFNAVSFVETKISVFSEINIFRKLVNLKIEYDQDYNKRFVLSNLMIHEQFGHISFSNNKSSFEFDIPDKLNIYKYGPSSPIETYSPLKGEFINITDPNSEVKKGVSEYTLAFYLTRGKKELYNMLENIEADFTELFQRVDLMVSEGLTEFCNKLNDVADKFGDLNENEEVEEEEKKNSFKSKYHNRISIKNYINYVCIPVPEKYS